MVQQLGIPGAEPGQGAKHEQKPKTRSNTDPEVLVMSRCLRILQTVESHSARRRILAYLSAKCEQDKSAQYDLPPQTQDALL